MKERCCPYDCLGSDLTEPISKGFPTRSVVKPTIDVVKKLADELNTTVGFLLGETNQVNVLKDPAMLKRLNDIDALPEEVKKHILYAIDGLLRDAKTRVAYK